MWSVVLIFGGLGHLRNNGGLFRNRDLHRMFSQNVEKHLGDVLLCPKSRAPSYVPNIFGWKGRCTYSPFAWLLNNRGLNCSSQNRAKRRWLGYSRYATSIATAYSTTLSWTTSNRAASTPLFSPKCWTMSRQCWGRIWTMASAKTALRWKGSCTCTVFSSSAVATKPLGRFCANSATMTTSICPKTTCIPGELGRFPTSAFFIFWCLWSLKVSSGCTTELSYRGQQFLSHIFEKYDKDGDKALSPSECEELFSTCPTPAWPVDVSAMVPTNDKGIDIQRCSLVLCLSEYELYNASRYWQIIFPAKIHID